MDESFSIINNGYDIDEVSSYLNELNIKIEYFKYLETLIDNKTTLSMKNYNKIINQTKSEMDLSIDYYNNQLDTIMNKLEKIKSNLKSFLSNMENLNLDVSEISSVDIIDLLATVNDTLNNFNTK